MTITRLRSIIIKELWAILRDPRTRIILLVPPVVQLLIFGLATTLEVKNMTLGVLDRDGGAWSQEVLQRVAGSPNVTRIIPLKDEQDLREAINRQHVIAALRFDSHFSADVASGRGGTIGLISDGRRSNAAQIVSGYLDQIAASVGATVSKAASAAPAPSGASIVLNWFNRNLDYLWFTMPALVAVMSAISAMSVVAQSVARERELGTYDQLMVSPLRVGEILVGKMVPPVLIGTFITTVYVLLIPLAFRVPLTGSVALLRRPLHLSPGSDRCRDVGVGALCHATAGVSRHVPRRHTGDSTVGLCKPGRQHAGLAAGHRPPGPGHLFPQGDRGSIPQGDARR